MTRTVAIYRFEGTSKAKTTNAILFVNEKTGLQTWLPLRCIEVKFTGPNFKCQVMIPDWLSAKLTWKQGEQKKENPYIGCDYGNLMEERMVLSEHLDYIAKHTPEYVALYARLQQMNEAVRLIEERAVAA
jgi:hypothetical protein